MFNVALSSNIEDNSSLTIALCRLKSINNQPIATSNDFDGNTGLLSKESILKKSIILDKQLLDEISYKIKDAPFIVSDIRSSIISSFPKKPFITSVLQQEANSKLGFSPKYCMTIAQKLYEAGYITYVSSNRYHF